MQDEICGNQLAESYVLKPEMENFQRKLFVDCHYIQLDVLMYSQRRTYFLCAQSTRSS